MRKKTILSQCIELDKSVIKALEGLIDTGKKEALGRWHVGPRHTSLKGCQLPISDESGPVAWVVKGKQDTSIAHLIAAVPGLIDFVEYCNGMIIETGKVEIKAGTKMDRLLQRLLANARGEP
jgi:hypothetical protein